MYSFQSVEVNYPLLFVNYAVGALFLIYFIKWQKLFKTFSAFNSVILSIYIFQIIGLPFSYGLNDIFLNLKLPLSIKYYQMALLYLGFFIIILGKKIVDIFFALKKNRSFVVDQTLYDQSITQNILIIFIALFAFANIIQAYRIIFTGYSYSPVDFLMGDIDKSGYFFTRHLMADEIYNNAALINWMYDKSLYGILSITTIYTIYLFKIKHQSRIIWLMLFIVIAFSQLLWPHKSRFVLLLIYIVLGILFAGKRQVSTKIFRSKLGLAGSGSFLALSAFLYTRQYDFLFVDGLKAVFYRIFVEPVRILELYMVIYPRVQPYLMGRSSQFISMLMNQEVQNPAIFVPQHYFGISNTSWPTLYLGNAWADYGIIGVIVFSLLLGMIVQMIDNWGRNGYFSPLKQSIYLAVVFLCLQFGQGAFWTTLLQGGVLLIIFIHFTARFMANSLVHNYSPRMQPNKGKEF